MQQAPKGKIANGNSDSDKQQKEALLTEKVYV